MQDDEYSDRELYDACGYGIISEEHDRYIESVFAGNMNLVRKLSGFEEDDEVDCCNESEDGTAMTGIPPVESTTIAFPES